MAEAVLLEAAEALAALAAEAVRLQAESAAGDAEARALKSVADGCRDALAHAESHAENAGKALAAATADRNAADRQRKEAETRLAAGAQQLEKAERDYEGVAATVPAEAAIEAANQAATEARRARNLRAPQQIPQRGFGGVDFDKRSEHVQVGPSGRWVV